MRTLKGFLYLILGGTLCGWMFNRIAAWFIDNPLTVGSNHTVAEWAVILQDPFYPDSFLPKPSVSEGKPPAAAAWGSLCPLRGSFNTRVARFTANEGAFLHKRSIWREKHNSIDSISAVRPWDWSALGRNRSHGVSRFPRPKNEKAP